MEKTFCQLFLKLAKNIYKMLNLTCMENNNNNCI